MNSELMNSELISQLESLGCRVITGSKYCVVDKGEKEGKRIVHNLDNEGEPIEITGVCVISTSESCKVYHGNSISQLKSSMRSKTATIKQGEIKDDKNLEDAFRDGDIHGIGLRARV